MARGAGYATDMQMHGMDPAAGSERVSIVRVRTLDITTPRMILRGEALCSGVEIPSPVRR